MDLADKLALIISAAALLLALASFIYTARSNQANRRKDDLQKVRLVLATNSAKFNGIMNGLASDANRSAEDLIEPTRLYSEVRDAYRSFRHRFSTGDRDELDAILDRVEEHFDPDDLASSLVGAMPLMPKFLEELEAKLNR